MSESQQLINETLQAGLTQHQGGHLAEAAAIYRQVLAIDPANADAMNLMGLVMQATDQLDVAQELISKAVELQPDFGAAWTNLGNVLQAQGRTEDAITALEKAVSLMPDAAEVWNNLASALNTCERYAPAENAAERALSLDENMAEAANNLGNARKGMGERDGAVKAYEAALNGNPDFADAWFNLGVLRLEDGDLLAAIDTLAEAWTRNPANAEAGSMYAAALLRTDQPEHAVTVCDKVLEAMPDHAGAWSNRGAALQVLRRYDEAVESFERAVTLEPQAADAHWNLALVLLEKGDWDAAWDEYEWRWDNPAFTTPRRHGDVPAWDGGPMEGQTLLVHAEQGMGDMFQFARLLPLVKERTGAKIVVECHPPLVRMMATVDGVDEAVPFDGPTGPVDVQVPMMTIPGHLELVPADLPGKMPYLFKPEGLAVPGVIANADGFKVGLIWAGSPTHGNDRNRSVAPDTLRRLLDVPGATFFSLQVSAQGRDVMAELAQLDPAGKVTDVGARLGDFADTAAALSGLDLLITVDTAAAHLAGAMGRDVWMLSPYAMSYLWMDTAPDTPWYPSMRVFRQAEAFDWDGVIDALVFALGDAIAD